MKIIGWSHYFTAISTSKQSQNHGQNHGQNQGKNHRKNRNFSTQAIIIWMFTLLWCIYQMQCVPTCVFLYVCISIFFSVGGYECDDAVKIQEYDKKKWEW